MGVIYGTPIIIINNEDSNNLLDGTDSLNIESNYYSSEDE